MFTCFSQHQVCFVWSSHSVRWTPCGHESWSVTWPDGTRRH